MAEQKTIVGVGEILWDLLPDGRRLGGAPANFTVMAARLGNCGIVASRLGSDDLGAQALRELNGFPIDASFIQTDGKYATGRVGVEFADGEPHYLIYEPVAWDFLAWTERWQNLATVADAVCYGTLAQRGAISRATIREFLASTRHECVRIFDVNLREPFYDADVIAESLSVATIFKLNEAELPLVLGMLGGANSGENTLLQGARWLLDRYSLRLVAITMGANGSLLVNRDEFHRHPGVPSSVVDTVGAGDAFTAALVNSYLRGATLAGMNEAGNRWGAWVASQPGAMPNLDPTTFQTITQQIADAQRL